MFCPRCGAQNDADARFCTACGNDVMAGGATAGPDPSGPPVPPPSAPPPAPGPPPAPPPPPPPPPPPGGSGIFAGSAPPPPGYPGSAGYPGASPYGGGPGAGQAPSGPRADFGSRLGAAFIDGAILFVAFLVVGIVTNGKGGPIVWLGGIAYYAYFEGSASGQTVGKRATSIRVISSLEAGPIGFGRGLLRYLGKVISGMALGLGYLWMLWDPERQTWQDKIANTFVVPVSAYPVQSWP
jgi:uncharacterized RDD family membrane protein YckC